MSFAGWHASVVRMIRTIVLETKNARGIMRKSGFRMSPSTAATSGEKVILTTPPCSPAKGCPRPPYGFPTSNLSSGERVAFYDTVARAEAEDPAAFVEMRDYLIALGMEDQIVMDGVMPNLRYDYAGELYTLTLDEDGACPIEVDIAPPIDDGFWEQYAAGDARFTAYDTFLADNNDYRALVKSVSLATAEIGIEQPYSYVNLNDSAIVPYPVCDETGPFGTTSTHHSDGVFAAPFDHFYQMVGYRENFGLPGEFPSTPEVYLTSDRLLDLKVAPEIDNTGLGNAANFGVVWSQFKGLIFPSPYTAAGKVTRDRDMLDTDRFFVDTAWRRCGDPLADLETEGEFFCSLSPNAGPTSLPVSATSWRDYRLWKDAPSGTQVIDWAIDPISPATTVLRYSQEWPTFDVVAVRMAAGGPALGSGSYVFP